jgi:hypothetical protein
VEGEDETVNPRARSVLVKARAVLRERGHSEGESTREYQDWHIEIRSGANYVTVWWSAGMVFLALAGVPVFMSSGPWESYLDRLFHHLPVNAQAPEHG